MPEELVNNDGGLGLCTIEAANFCVLTKLMVQSRRLLQLG